MKKLLFLVIMTGIFSGHNIYSQVEESPDVEFVIKARPAAEASLMKIARVQDSNGFPVRFQPDYSIGNKFVTEMWVDGKFYYGNPEVLSNEMNGKMKNASGALSINDLCPAQAWAMRDVFNQGSKFREDYLRKLAEQANKKVADDCNCPDNPDLQENYDRRVVSNTDGLGDGRIYVSDIELRKVPEYNQIILNPEVKKRGKWWIIPVAIIGVVGTYAILDGVIDGEWWEWFDDPFTSTETIIIYTNPNDPNDPNYDPNHNGNGGIFGKAWEKPLVNSALESWAQPHRGGGIISFPIFGGRAP